MTNHLKKLGRCGKLRHASWLAVTGAVGLLAAGAAQGITLHVDDDTFVNENNPTANMDNFQFLQVRADGTGRDRQPLARFNLSALPTGVTGAEVEKATLRMFVRTFSTAGTVNVHAVTSGWSEETVTWNTAPTFTALAEGSTDIGTAASNNGNEYVTVDITGLVQDWVDGVLVNNGVVLIGDVADATSGNFDAKNNQEEGHAVEIEVVLTTNAETLCAAGELLDGSGACVPVTNGDITSVSPGTGLAGGGASGDVVLSIAPSGVTSTQVLNESLTSNDLGPNSVGQSEIQTGGVASAEVLDNSLTANDLAANSVGASEIATNAVGVSEIAANAVGQSEIATNGVASLEIQDNTVSSNDILNNTIRDFDIGDEAGVETTQSTGEGSINTLSTTWTIVQSVGISAPTSGTVVCLAIGNIDYGITVAANGNPPQAQVGWDNVGGSSTPPAHNYTEPFQTGSAGPEMPIMTAREFSVSSGVTTFNVKVRRSNALPAGSIFYREQFASCTFYSTNY